MDEMIEEIIKQAKSSKTINYEDGDNPMEYSGGNFDDTYAIGTDDGWVEFAQHLVAKYHLEENIILNAQQNDEL